MKKKIISFISLFIVILCFYFCSFVETHYTREGIVVENNDNLITVKDECGYLWDFEGNDFKVNERVKLTMDTNHTDSNIFDDKIIHVKKIEAQ